MEKINCSPIPSIIFRTGSLFFSRKLQKERTISTPGIVKIIGNASNQPMPISLSPRQNRMIHRRVIVPFNVLSQRDVSFCHNKRTVTLPSPPFTTLHTCDLCPCVAPPSLCVALTISMNRRQQWSSFTTRAFVLRVCPAYSRAQRLKILSNYHCNQRQISLHHVDRFVHEILSRLFALLVIFFFLVLFFFSISLVLDARIKSDLIA